MFELIPLTGLVFGVLLIGYTVGKVTGLIRLWMKQRHEREYGDTVNRKLIRAFKEFKRDTERRLQNLEAIIADDSEKEQSGTNRIKEPSKSIEIEEQDEQSGSASGDDRNLRNMLNE